MCDSEAAATLVTDVGTSQRMTAAWNQNRSKPPAIRRETHQEQTEQTESRRVSAENKHGDPGRHESSCSLAATCVYSREQARGQTSLSATLCCDSAAAVDGHGADTLCLEL